MTEFSKSPAKRIFSIAWPAIGEAYLQNSLGVVDSLFIARIGLIAIDAVGVTNIYSMTFIGVFTAASTAVAVFLSRAFGGNDTNRGKATISHGMFIAFIVGLLFPLFHWYLLHPLLHLVGAYVNLKSTARPYFRMVLGISPLLALFTVQSAVFRAIGDTKTPLRVGLEMNAIHVVLDYVLIFGIGPVHGFGLLGAAWAMRLARTYALSRLWWKSRNVHAIRLERTNFHLQLDLFTSMTRFAVPAALERLSMRLGQVIYFGLIVRMGVDVYATHNIAGTLTIFRFYHWWRFCNSRDNDNRASDWDWR